jgi:hypothetical protein
MRDQHWERCHQGRKENWFQQTPDEDEIQPLLFDLVRADKVQIVKTLLPRLIKCPFEVRVSLFSLAARSGSTAMVDLFEPGTNNIMNPPDKHIDFGKTIGKLVSWRCRGRNDSMTLWAGLHAAIEGTNIETFGHLLLISQRNCAEVYALLLPELLKMESKEFRLGWEINVEAEHEAWIKNSPSRNNKSHTPFGDRYTTQALLKTATGNPENETFILLLWEKIKLVKVLTPKYLGNTLTHVAATCRSVKLAKYLVEVGAPVDYRNNYKCLTPLHYAVTSDTLEAAELVKFLLGLGADPLSVVSSGSRFRPGKIRRIRDEVGAKGISKWLGMSWDDLVENIGAERTEVDKTGAERP